MAVYTVDMTGGGQGDQWADAASALATAMTPDYDAMGQAKVRQAQAANNLAGAGANDALARQRNAEAVRAEEFNARWDQLQNDLRNDGYSDMEILQLKSEAAYEFGVLDQTLTPGNIGDYNLAQTPFMDVTPEQTQALQTGSGMAWGTGAVDGPEKLYQEGQQAIELERTKPLSEGQVRYNDDGTVHSMGVVEADQGDRLLLPEQVMQGPAGDATVSNIFEGSEGQDTRTVKNYRIGNQNFLTNDGITDIQTGEPLPPHGVLGSITADDSSGLDTEGARRSGQFVVRMEVAEDALRESMLNFDGGVPNIASYYLAAPKDSFGAQLMAGQIVDDQTKAFMSSAQQFLTAILRMDSGAAVPVSEYPMYYTQFIPMPGDGPETLMRKERARAAAMVALRAGLSADEILDEAIATVGSMEISPALAEISNNTRRRGDNSTGATSAGGASATYRRDDSGKLVKVE